MTYNDIITALINGVNFSFSRFGDGEMLCSQGKQGHNCDGHLYTPDLAGALNKVLNEPRGIMGLMDKAQELSDRCDWVDGTVMVKASVAGDLKRLERALNGRDTIMVGPAHLRKLTFYSSFIEVPLRNAWREHHKIRHKLEKNIWPECVVVYACGMMAPVLIWELYKDDFTQIDVGAVFDPYCGVKSRQYHKKLKI